MKPATRQSTLEWVFLALLAVLCGGLAALQFRWTGELGKAEQLRLRTSLNEQLLRIGSVFDTELQANCNALMPTPRELEELGPDKAHAMHFEKWAAGQTSRHAFKRIAIAVPNGPELDLLEINGADGALRDEPWPAEWSALREGLLGRPSERESPRPVTEPASPLIEFPIPGPDFDDPGRPPPADFRDFPPDRRPRHESEWMIFELNLRYIADTWMPFLIKTHLNTGASPEYDVEVRANDAARSLIYASNSGSRPMGANADASAPFFAIELPRREAHGPGNGRWTIFARHRAGSLEAAVAAARRRNLLVAALLNGLIFTAGCALVRHTRRSRQLAEAQMKFVASVSHELRTPLTVIRGAGHNLQRGIVREPAQIEQYAGLIVQHAEQLTAMVEQVLTFAGATRAESATRRQPVAIGEILREAVAAAASEVEAAHCTLEVNIAEELPPVSGDASALRRAFQNLIANAARHAAEGGWIGLAATLGGGQTVKVQVMDRGPGIPKNEQEKIFQPFVRGAASEAKQIRGSGLGLSLVREIVEAHGGSISVHSENGQGTVFIVRLPIAKT